jgi:hypothetical protein
VPALLLLTAAPALGDWITYQDDVQHTGQSAASFDPRTLTRVWSAPTGYEVPLVVGDNVIAMRNQFGVGSDLTSVTSFRLADGAVNWTYTNRFVFPSQPTYSNGLVVYTATDFPPGGPTRLYVQDASTGALLYTVTAAGSLGDAMPTVSRNPVTGNLVAYVAGGSSLTAISLGATSGSVLWTQSGSFGGQSIPTIVGNSVVLAGPGQYYAFDQTTGAPNHFHAGNLSGGGGTTVVYDEARREFYVRETYNTSVGTALTAYSYVDQNNIVQLWQRTGPGIGSGASVAIGPDGKIYSVDNTTLVELDPATGAVLRSLGGQSFANAITPILSDGYLWVYSESQTLVYDLNTLTLVRSLPGSRGSLNSAYDGPGALSDGYFLLDYGAIYNRPGFDVYAAPQPVGAVPEPSALTLLGLGILGLLGGARLRRRGA